MRPTSLHDGLRGRASRCTAPRACKVRIAKVLKDDLSTSWTKHEVLTTLHHARIAMQRASDLEDALIVQSHEEVVAAEDGVERNTNVEGTPTKSEARQKPKCTPEKGARKRKPKSGTPPTKKEKAKPMKRR